ncbi:MAG: N-acetylneuraminate synthase family protein [Acidobacteriota bacterium]
MSAAIRIGDRLIGDGQPVYVIAEIGLNHNGDIGIAKKLIDAASFAGCDAVKFQKRTVERCVPIAQRNIPRETPWGVMTYLEYRKRVEFDADEYAEISAYCKGKQITWFTSCWDEESVDFMEQVGTECYKVPSASLTDDSLLIRMRETGKPVILSTGMSTMEEIKHAVGLIPTDQLLLAHATSTYPCHPSELNLNMIRTLKQMWDCPVGYSGHEVGLQTTCAAVTLGATFVERHITLDRTMWGSDQAASVEPMGMMRMVRDIRVIESAMGDGLKRVYESEKPALDRLRRVRTAVSTKTSQVA